VLVGPDLAKAFGILFGTSAVKVANRRRLEVDVDGVVGRIELLVTPIPLPAIGLVPRTPSGSFT
jgi:hypothetical protein